MEHIKKNLDCLCYKLYDARYASFLITSIKPTMQLIMPYEINNSTQDTANKPTKVNMQLIFTVNRICGLYLQLCDDPQTLATLYNNDDIISINVRCGYKQRVYRIKIKKLLENGPIVGSYYCFYFDEIRDSKILDSVDNILSFEMQINPAQSNETNQSQNK
eukprot:808168_1